ncbi:hypothetical protein [Nocardioides sp. B-3]|uniref:hypothetical protein n=1 Tax=Nocardioides sp. B-3 TaxID=2895565 RepID=UPI00215356E4|nr:hypothetical protein [Nocardioides sp. B-3]UUZ60997.1 hypothetical protein LP418_10125 [Nocardioides sp. B-3]
MTSSIFDALTADEAARVRAAGTPLTLPAGWSPISERTPADKAYILTSGEVSMYAATGPRSPRWAPARSSGRRRSSTTRCAPRRSSP